MPEPINANTTSVSPRDASARFGKALQYRAARGASAALSDDDGPATDSGNGAERVADGGEFGELLARMQAASAAGTALSASNSASPSDGSTDLHEQLSTSAQQQVQSIVCRSAPFMPLLRCHNTCRAQYTST